MEKTEHPQEEQERLLFLLQWEDILEKKVKIYARLLTDPALAKTMEDMGLRCEKRKDGLLSLAFGKTQKKKNDQGRCEMNTEKTE